MMAGRQIGLHIRYLGSFSEVAQRAVQLQLPLFQCFLVLKSTGNLVVSSEEDIQAFLTLRRNHFEHMYVHGSYWINLAGIHNTGHRALARELAMARKLEFTHFIIHPGSAHGAENKQIGITALANSLNELLRKDLGIQIVLENSAHGSLSIGGDLDDFAALLSQLEQPDKLLFCIDTAHAHSYGYDIGSAHAREEFIQKLEATIGINKIALLHLNDTQEACGSKIDRHAMVGMGCIGEQALKEFCLHKKLAHIPMIMELPVVPCHEEENMLAHVRSWHE